MLRRGETKTASRRIGFRLNLIFVVSQLEYLLYLLLPSRFNFSCLRKQPVIIHVTDFLNCLLCVIHHRLTGAIRSIDRVAS